VKKTKKGFTLIELPVVRKRGFTLIELLVVIFIIGLLATLIIVNVNAARGRARDSKRKADLRAYQTAVEMYYQKNQSYFIKTPDGKVTGRLNLSGIPTSSGWLNFKGNDLDRGYNFSIAQALKDSGVIDVLPYDPSVPLDSSGYQTCTDDTRQTCAYLYYTEYNSTSSDYGEKYALFAHLEDPSDEDLATRPAGCNENLSGEDYFWEPCRLYHMNYYLGNGWVGGKQEQP